MGLSYGVVGGMVVLDAVFPATRRRVLAFFLAGTQEGIFPRPPAGTGGRIEASWVEDDGTRMPPGDGGGFGAVIREERHALRT